MSVLDLYHLKCKLEKRFRVNNYVMGFDLKIKQYKFYDFIKQNKQSRVKGVTNYPM